MSLLLSLPFLCDLVGLLTDELEPCLSLPLLLLDTEGFSSSSEETFFFFLTPHDAESLFESNADDDRRVFRVLATQFSSNSSDDPLTVDTSEPFSFLESDPLRRFGIVHLLSYFCCCYWPISRESIN